MKRLFGILVLCVVAQASFGALLAEYEWVGTSGNFTDVSWTCNQTVAPALPFYSANTADWVAYARPYIRNGGNINVTTDLALITKGGMGDENFAGGFQQMQITKGTVTVDNGGELKIHTGYLYTSANTGQGNGLILQNGGRYINTATSTGNQAGTLINYTTTNGVGNVWIKGAGNLFDTIYLYGGRHGQTQVRYSNFNVEGSGSTINTGIVGPGGNNITMTYNFTTDAGGVSAINVATSLAFQQGVTVTHTANTSVLKLFLGAAPTEGQQLVLFDLAAGAKRTGTLKDKWGYALTEGEHISAYWGEEKTYWKITYYGGETGNDVVLTLVPEPATLGLLGLGGLVLARRRRA